MQDEFEIEVNRVMKEALLEQYQQREPREFVQFDGFTNTWVDSVIQSDEDGDGVMRSLTKELMSGCSAVRVLIRSEEDAVTAVRLLRKIADRIDRENGLWPKDNNPTLTCEGEAF